MGDDFVDGTHPGFTITCDACGSKRVYVDNSMGFSATSGGWGSVDIVCADCGAEVDVASAL